MRRASSALAACALALVASHASATAANLFGMGAKSAALAGADVADAEPSTSAFTSPAAADERGVRIAVGYGYGAPRLELSGERAPVRDVSGLDLGVQLGRAIGEVRVGGAVALHLPDGYLARIGFRPGAEPQFVLYEASLQRMTFDGVLAAGLGPLSIGAGASVVADVGGNGVDFALGQDATGTYADAATDLTLPYHVAPIAGARLDLGKAALALRYRAPIAIDLDLDTRARVAIQANPLDGLTNVAVRGASGYDPATIDLASRIDVSPFLRALVALEYQRWSAAPSPAADVALELHLGTNPSELQGKFVEPRLRDTLSPRVGVELRPSGAEGALRLYGGYAYSPSPVPAQNGFTSYADAPRHTLALGAGWSFGRVFGVDLAARAAAQLHLLPTRHEDKPDDALPNAHYTAGGHIVYGSAMLEATWR